MPQGNWPCSGCGGTITELPFEPRSTAGLLCRDCFMNKKGGGGKPGSGVAPTAPSDTGNSADLDDREAPPFDPDEMGASEAPDMPAEAFGEGAETVQPGEKKMFEGEWTCSVCGGAITKLPFAPRGDASNLKCIDCFKNSKS